MTWNDYQKNVAAFFISIGAQAETDATVRGVRGVHKVDVLVKLTHFGINVIWIVECKLWKTAVPKDKVLTLQQIVQDIGADRGLLMSESGFQAGAIRCTQSSNITLSSLNELKEIANDELYKTRFKTISHRLKLLTDRYHTFIPWNDFSYIRPLQLVDNSFPNLFTIRTELFKAMSNSFPIRLFNSTVSDVEEFIESCETIFQDAEKEIAKVENEYNANLTNKLKFYRSLMADTWKLIEACKDLVINRDSPEEQYSIRIEAVKVMKRIGSKTLKIRACTNNNSFVYFKKIHNVIIDQLYLDLLNQNLQEKDIDVTRANLENAYLEFEKFFQPISSPPAPTIPS
ncbi:MAG TPA: restriction endonuclease [Pedobacter sp.]|jgi:hypothetical protein